MNYIENNNIKFERGSILTKNIIQNIYDYPRDLIDIIYSQYPDGIIKGLQVYKKNSDIFLSKGILKYKDEYFIFKENINLENLFTNLVEGTNYSIYFENLGTSGIENNFTTSRLELKIIPFSKYSTLENDQVCFLGKFTYYNEIKIQFPKTIQDLDKRRHYCFNNIDVNYSHHKENTYCPSIGTLILNYLKMKEKTSPLDFTLMCELSKDNTIGYETVCFYIKTILNKNVENLSRENIFDLFLESIYKPYEGNIQIKEIQKESIKKEKFEIKSGLL